MNVRAPLLSEDRCGTCPVRAHTVCHAADAVTTRSLRSFSRTVCAGSDFISQGEIPDNFYIVMGGWACLYDLLEDGRRQILKFLLPGDVVGLVIDEHGASFGAQAITAVTACVVPRHRFLQLARDQGHLAIHLVRLFARQEALAYGHLTSVGRRTARERVAHLLLELFCRIKTGIPHEPGEEIVLPLTQAHVGDALGLTPVHINRMLRGLREDGIIQLSHHTLQILDPDRLAVAAGFEQEVVIPGLPESQGRHSRAPVSSPQSYGARHK